MIRRPVVAGRFYPAETSECRETVARLTVPQERRDSFSQAFGAIVPHAGWSYSGAVTGKTLRMLSDFAVPETVVLIGAVHARSGSKAALFPAGEWQTPLGEARVDERHGRLLLAGCPHIETDPDLHRGEHSLEVQLPFVQELFPEAAIIPLMVPPSAAATEIGAAIGKILAPERERVVIIGTTDLTHYGPSYGFTGRGSGNAGREWAKKVNDRRMIDLICGLRDEAVISEAAEHRNACGPGAVAATIAACKVLGAQRALLLQHTTSYEVVHSQTGGESLDAVGYAGIVFVS